MPYLKTYNLFISHAWAYGESYNRLINLLNQAPYFSYKNYSAPAVWMEKPIIGIRPFGSTRTPSAVESVADVMVSWNTNSIISAIRDLSL